MFNAPTPTLYQDETLIKSQAATRHGYNKSCVFALTNSRVIFKTLYSEDWFPLSRLKTISRTGVFLNLEFDNGSKEIVSVLDSDQWVSMIEQVKVNAPEMAYQVGGSKPLAARLNGTVIIIMILGGWAAGCSVLCMLAALLYFTQ